MAPEILVVMTPDIQDRAPEPLIFRDLVNELRFDPREPWYPCGCPDRFEDAHDDDCWLGWSRYPRWMTEDTQVIDTIGQQLALVVSDVDDEDGTHD